MSNTISLFTFRAGSNIFIVITKMRRIRYNPNPTFYYRCHFASLIIAKPNQEKAPIRARNPIKIVY